MKAIYLHAAGAIALTFSIAACVPSAKMPIIVDTPEPVAQPAPMPSRTTTPAPVPVVQEPVYENYLDAPQTPGTWRYFDDPDESLAIFSEGATFDRTRFALRCEKRTSTISLGVWTRDLGNTPRTMRVQTETARRELPATLLERQPYILGVDLDPRDTLLDAMAITKGRFAVALEGERTLYLPAWVEVSRVIEDCR